MPLHRIVLTLTLSTLAGACAAHTHRTSAAPRPASTFHLVNATFDSITAVAMAASGSDRFRRIPLGRPLQGGLDEVTFAVPAGGCMRDLRVTFRDGHTWRQTALDVCRVHGLRLHAHPDTDGVPAPDATHPRI